MRMMFLSFVFRFVERSWTRTWNSWPFYCWSTSLHDGVIRTTVNWPAAKRIFEEKNVMKEQLTDVVFGVFYDSFTVFALWLHHSHSKTGHKWIICSLEGNPSHANAIHKFKIHIKTKWTLRDAVKNIYVLFYCFTYRRWRPMCLCLCAFDAFQKPEKTTRFNRHSLSFLNVFCA